MSISWKVKHFSELSLLEFHDIVSLRLEVFVVEQNCSYQELDGKDKKSYHLKGRDGLGNVVATARILPAGISYPEVSIGRVCVAKSQRGQQIGIELMKRTLDFIQEEFGSVSVRISAQKYLEEFYKSFGFESTGKEYLEDEIPHVEMLLDK